MRTWVTERMEREEKKRLADEARERKQLALEAQPRRRSGRLAVSIYYVVGDWCSLALAGGWIEWVAVSVAFHLKTGTACRLRAGLIFFFPFFFVFSLKRPSSVDPSAIRKPCSRS